MFSTVFASEILAEEPGIRNSNRFPVKAKGLVRLRSVLSFANLGRTSTPRSILTLSGATYSLSEAIASKMAERSSPTNTLTMAGGASPAPRRCSLPALAIHIRSRS
ncbi:hypothetical protein EVA_08606 [gut metagenome]|uniref:Uncharacterized protein n=1 Tax=gut metagenome TaxID=749906 RepID=J9GM32_9ZZZZ